MFTPIDRLPPPHAEPVIIHVDGEAVVARAGDTVAIALLRAGIAVFRNVGPEGPRGPYCLAGLCADCRVAADGVPEMRACTLVVRAGLRIERPAAPSDVAPA